MENIFTENILLNISGLGIAALSLFVIWFVIKKFAGAIKDFNRILGNHLTHQEKMFVKDIESREEYTKKFTELISDIKVFFRKD